MPKPCWIILYTHKYGADAWPVFQKRKPSIERIQAQLEAELGQPFDEDYDSLEIRGPWANK